MKRERLLTLACFSFFFLCGFFVNVGGTVSGRMAESLGATTAAVGYCFTAFMVGRVIGIMGNGALLHRRGMPLNLFVRLAPLLGLASAIGLWFTGSLAFLAAVLLVAGTAIGWLYSLSNIILTEVRRGPERAMYISVMNFLFSAGGVASPFLSGLILKSGFSWRYPYLVFGALCLLALALSARADFSGLFAGPGEAVRDEGRPRARHWIFCLAMACYILAEYSLSYWTPVYLREARGKDPLFAGSCVSAFWMAILAGRLLHSLLVKRIKPLPFILGSGILALAAVLVFTRSRSEAAMVASVAAAGLGCAGLFPSLYSLGIELGSSLKRSYPTLLMLSAAAGSFLAMPSGSAVKTAAGIGALPLVPAIALALMCLLAYVSRGLPQARR